MTFITKPTEEGETKDCQKCDTPLISRWTDYKGQWEDKLQWQTLEPRKAHYDKDGNCKTEATQQETPETTTPKPTLDIPEPDAITSPHIDKQLILISQIEKKVISYLGNDAVPAKIGLYVKLIYDGIVRQ